MRIKIDSDVFNISNRLKEIDSGYFVMYNLSSKKFEIHNNNQKNTYCLTIPYGQLDTRTIDFVNKTSIRNYDKIIKNLDKNNANIEKNNLNKAKEINDYKIREIFKHSNLGSETLKNAFSSKWV